MQEHEVGHRFSGHYRTLVETEPNLRSLSGLLSAHEVLSRLRGCCDHHSRVAARRSFGPYVAVLRVIYKRWTNFFALSDVLPVFDPLR